MSCEINKLINQFVEHYPEGKNIATRWKEPLTAYADAEDEMFYQLKSAVSPSHALPKDLLKEARTVVAYFIPFDADIVRSNIDGRECSKAWAEAYAETDTTDACGKCLVGTPCSMTNPVKTIQK